MGHFYGMLDMYDMGYSTYISDADDVPGPRPSVPKAPNSTAMGNARLRRAAGSVSAEEQKLATPGFNAHGTRGVPSYSSGF